jgi:hypothetical protein
MWKVAEGFRANIIYLGEAAIRPPNGEMRKVGIFLAWRIYMEQKRSNSRRYLTADELEKLMKAARNGRYGRRDATLMLLMARHGLRLSTCAGIRSTFRRAICTSGGLKAVFIPFTRSKATSCGRYANLDESSNRNPPSFSPPSVAGL